MKTLLGLLLIVGLSVGQTLNFSGYSDTANITTFKADSLKYTKAFALSQYENIRSTVIFDDTSAAGRGSDSVKFYYWIEYGHLEPDLNGTLDTIWSQKDPLIIDTVDALTAGNFSTANRNVASDGTYNYPLKTIDTLSFAVGRGSVQTRNFTSEFDTYCRFGFKGLTGNEKGSFIKLRLSLNRRVGSNVRVK